MAYYAKFTERGQRALLAAQREAAELGRTYVGTEHLLLGVLTEPGGATVFPSVMPRYAPKSTSIRSFMVTTVTLEIKVSNQTLPFISAKSSCFCFSTLSSWSMYCSGNLGLWNR